MIRVAGAILLIASCGSFGFLIGFHYYREIRILRGLLCILQQMEWELKYKLTPLPDLCGNAAMTTNGKLREFFLNLQFQMEIGDCYDIFGSMNSLIYSMDFPYHCRVCLKEMGKSLGQYDLDGQLNGIRSVQEQCRAYLNEMNEHRSERVRSYQTLALCAGTALVILLV